MSNQLLSRLNPLREMLLFKVAYWTARVGLGIAFILSGVRKLPGVKFTALPVDNPVGFYFQAMYETGFYWNFIGVFQILVGMLVFWNRFAVLAILLMMPVTINIFLVSVALNMKGTPVITALMVLGNLYLLFWHYEHYLPLLKKTSQIRKERV